MGNDRGDCYWKFLILNCRFFGLLTAVALWGVGVEYAVYGYVFGIYFIIIALITSFLELVFLLNHIVELCVSRTSFFLRVWDWVLFIDDWKKGGLYFVFFAPPCFVHPAEAVLSVTTGCLLILIGVLYMLKTFKTRRDEEEAGLEDSDTYDRFRNDQEDIEDDIVNPTSSPTSGISGLADQNEILDL